MNNVHYDREVIQQFANAMYEKAKKLVLIETIKYAFAGGIAFAILANYISPAFTGLPAFLLGAVICGYFGYQAGLMKSFHLKLEAQRALCLVETEKNTNSQYCEKAA